MNRTASDPIAAVMQVLIFFLEDSFIFFCVPILINIIGNELGDKSNVTHNWGPKKSRFAKRGPQSSRFTKKGVRKVKSLGTSAVGANTKIGVIMSQIIIQVTNSPTPWYLPIFCLHFEMVVAEDIPE